MRRTPDPAWYASQSPVTLPGDQARLFSTAPRTIAALAGMIHGLFLHPLWAHHHGVILDDGHREHLQLRFVRDMLRRLQEIDANPLAAARPPGRRLIGNCRDQSVFLCALLRHQSVPARVRCGFSPYFEPARWVDHWVCEYWNGRRWVGVDPQLDSLQRQSLGLTFDPLDLPPGQFLTGAQAWMMCRGGQADAQCFGIADLRGLWFVRGNLVRDLAALNRAEMLPWDGWGLAAREDREITPAHRRLLDRVARAVAGEDPALHDLYSGCEELRVPAHLLGENRT